MAEKSCRCDCHHQPGCDKDAGRLADRFEREAAKAELRAEKLPYGTAAHWEQLSHAEALRYVIRVLRRAGGRGKRR